MTTKYHVGQLLLVKEFPSMMCAIEEITDERAFWQMSVSNSPIRNVTLNTIKYRIRLMKSPFASVDLLAGNLTEWTLKEKDIDELFILYYPNTVKIWKQINEN